MKARTSNRSQKLALHVLQCVAACGTALQCAALCCKVSWVRARTSYRSKNLALSIVKIDIVKVQQFKITDYSFFTC